MLWLTLCKEASNAVWFQVFARENTALLAALLTDATWSKFHFICEIAYMHPPERWISLKTCVFQVSKHFLWVFIKYQNNKYGTPPSASRESRGRRPRRTGRSGAKGKQ
jgi:hypothetical protein